MAHQHIYSYTVQELLDASSESKFLSPMAWTGNTLQTGMQDRTEIEEYVAFLQKCIANIDQAVEVLQHTRSEIKSNQDKYHNMLNPILRVPPEILKHVFRYCIDEWMSVFDDDIVRGGCYRPAGNRLCPRRTVTQVCRYMRNVALESPEFWRDIEPRHHNVSSPGNPRLAREIGLSRNLPLRIYFDQTPWEYVNHVESFSQRTQLLADTCSRWTSFKSFSSLQNLLIFVKTLPAGTPRFPRIASLSGQWDNACDSCDPNIDATDLPSLQYLDLDLLQYRRVGAVPMPWSQLLHLRLHSPPPLHAYAILPQLTAVVHLYLQLTNHHTKDITIPTQPIVLPCVRELTLDMNNRKKEYGYYHSTEERNLAEIAKVGFISLFRLPALQTLSCNALSMLGFDAIIKMLQANTFQSSPQHGVQTLELSNMDLEHQSRYPLLFRELPNLKSLTLRHFGHKTFSIPVDLLAIYPKDEGFCLQLERLSLSHGDIDRKALECFVTSHLNHEKLSGELVLKYIELNFITCPLQSQDLSYDDHTSTHGKQEHSDGIDASRIVEGDSEGNGKVLIDALETFAQRPGASLSINSLQIFTDYCEIINVKSLNGSKYLSARILQVNIVSVSVQNSSIHSAYPRG